MMCKKLGEGDRTDQYTHALQSLGASNFWKSLSRRKGDKHSLIKTRITDQSVSACSKVKEEYDD
jgi:hypothetical protein